MMKPTHPANPFRACTHNPVLAIFRRFAAGGTLLLLALGGCLGHRTEEILVPPEILSALPAQVGAPADAMPLQAMIRPGLVLNITVLAGGKKEIEELGRRIGEDHSLTLPFLGTLKVKDETLGMLTERLTGLYREFYVDPQVLIEFVRDESPNGVSPWGHVTVMGRVKRPGRVNIPPTRDLTVSTAIQQAGGFDTSARDTAIRVIRREPGNPEVSQIKVDLRAVGRQGKLENDIRLKPDDVVYVPELFF